MESLKRNLDTNITTLVPKTLRDLANTLSDISTFEVGNYTFAIAGVNLEDTKTWERQRGVISGYKQKVEIEFAYSSGREIIYITQGPDERKGKTYFNSSYIALLLKNQSTFHSKFGSLVTLESLREVIKQEGIISLTDKLDPGMKIKLNWNGENGKLIGNTIERAYSFFGKELKKDKETGKAFFSPIQIGISVPFPKGTKTNKVQVYLQALLMKS